jgi:hypothetical protein
MHAYRFLICTILTAGLIAAGYGPALATLTLTPAGIADGFGLSLFVDQVPFTTNSLCVPGCGPAGIATNNLGEVVFNDSRNLANYVFNDVDNQHFSQALSSAPFGSITYGIAITNDGGTLYAGNDSVGQQLFKLNPDGSSAGAVPGTSGTAGHGLATNPASGHVVAASANGVFDIDPVTGIHTQIANATNIDGVSVSADGKTIYGATHSAVLGWNYSGMVVYNSGNIGSTDGTGVIQGAGKFVGDIIVNDNDGIVMLLDPVAHTAVTIASGGSRGDYVGTDLTNGSLFLTQTDSVFRLTCGPDCSSSQLRCPNLHRSHFSAWGSARSCSLGVANDHPRPQNDALRRSPSAAASSRRRTAHHPTEPLPMSTASGRYGA